MHCSCSHGFVVWLFLCISHCTALSAQSGDFSLWEQAAQRGRIHAECGRCANQVLHGWLDLKQDPKTHLFSREAIWDYQNQAADHYSSLVLMAHYVAPQHNEPGGMLHKTLLSQRELCGSRFSGLPTSYDLATSAPVSEARMTDLAEWLRDGLLRITEIKGRDNDWYVEMERLVDAMLAEADRRGGLYKAMETDEARGNLLQTLARLYVISGREKYIKAAETLADVVLLEDRPPVSKLLIFVDHGCELVPGLSELFVVECKLKRPRAESYREPLQKLVDAIQADGANPETGILSGTTTASDGSRSWRHPPDTWGYVLFSFENYDRATGENRYRKSVEKPVRWLLNHRPQYRQLRETLWPHSSSSDDWNDSYESMIVLWNRYRTFGDAFEWLDWATLQSDHRRQIHESYGPYRGGHFDGSTGRCLCMHMMLCSQGIRAVPFDPSLDLGAIEKDGELFVSVKSANGWKGKLVFDGSRCDYTLAKIDWARLNEMPQWFSAKPDATYHVIVDALPAEIKGSELVAGLPFQVKSDQSVRIHITLPKVSAPTQTQQTSSNSRVNSD